MTHHMTMSGTPRENRERESTRAGIEYDAFQRRREQAGIDWAEVSAARRRPFVPELRAAFILSCAFSPDYGFLGGCTSLIDLQRHGLPLRARLHIGSLREAVQLIIRRNMESADAPGRGAKAQNRLRAQRLADVYAGVPPFTPTETELNRMAAADEERYTEGRKHRPFPANPHL